METPFRLFLATDYSGYVGSAEKYAAKLAQQGDVLGIMHVYNPPLEGSLSCFEPANPPYYEKEKLQKHMEHVMTNLEPKPSRLNYTCMVQDGVNVAESIVESAENFGSDIVIVGTHGAGNREDVLLGSHAWDVIQKSRVPVLAVPDGTDFITSKKFLFVSDCDEREMPVLHLISSIVSRMKGELIVLYISKNEPPSDKKQEDPFLFLDNLKNQLSIKKLRTEVVYENHMDVGLEHYSRKYKPDWLIVSFEKLGQLNKLYQSGHRDHRMKFITRVPLLVVPDYSYLSGQA